MTRQNCDLELCLRLKIMTYVLSYFRQKYPKQIWQRYNYDLDVTQKYTYHNLFFCYNKL